MREKWIDNAKGIAILLVILGHVSSGVEDIFSFKFVYGIHLVMFFLLSGYTTKRNELTVSYINKRFCRLMVPYFITCFAIIVSDALNSIFIYNDASIASISSLFSRDLLRSFFASGTITTFGSIDVGARIGAIWFLPAMFFAGLFLQLLLNKTNNSLYLGLITFGIAVIGIITARFIWLPFSIQSAMLAVFFIWIGYEIKNRNLLSKIKWFYYLIALVILLTGIQAGYCFIIFVTASINDIILSVPVSLAGCLLIYLLSKLDRHGKVLEFLGKNSLIIICVHLFMLETRYRCMSSLLDSLRLSGYTREWMLIVVEILFAILLTAVILLIRHLFSNPNKALLSRQSHADDIVPVISICQGICILFMICIFYEVDSRLNSVIYSVLGFSFLFFAGYNHKQRKSILSDIINSVIFYFIPYLIVLGIRIITLIPSLSSSLLLHELKKYILGMSASGKLFPETDIIGPEYFFLLIFATSIVCSLIERLIKKEVYGMLVMFILSIVGYLLGKNELFLPWNIDCVCFVAQFYYIGIFARKHDCLTKIRNIHILYFILSSIWVYVMYSSSVRIFDRSWGKYGFTIIGVLSAIALLFKFSAFIFNHLPILSFVLRYIGRCSKLMLVIATATYGWLQVLISRFYTTGSIANLAILLCLYIVISVIIRALIDYCSSLII